MIRLLIVEDNMYYSKYIINEIIKNSKNIKIEYIANNGKEALEIMKKRHFDLITLDLKMPKCSGIEVINQISNMKNIPQIIVLSGESESINKIQEKSIISRIINKYEDAKSIYTKIQEQANTIEIKKENIIIKKKLQKNYLIWDITLNIKVLIIY